ncbi:MAG: type II secretion system protein GspG [Kiritimatiellae bacterium]|nr:type II secretion system protein GspG [Kiritimatiellia bacterium]
MKRPHTDSTCRAYRRGFTLVEIMIVVAIIGLLSSIAIPSFMKARHQSRVTRAQRDLTVLSGAIEQLVWDTGYWPGPQTPDEVNASGGNEVWDLSLPAAGIVAATAAFRHWDGPYMKSVPKDPWGNNYFFDTDYELGGQHFVVVGSFGPNGIGPNLYDADDVCVIVETK